MLVLRRRDGESITLRVPGYPTPIRITTWMATYRGKPSMRLAIDAPREVAVSRDEINSGPSPVGTVPQPGQ